MKKYLEDTVDNRGSHQNDNDKFTDHDRHNDKPYNDFVNLDRDLESWEEENLPRMKSNLENRKKQNVKRIKGKRPKNNS